MLLFGKIRLVWLRLPKTFVCGHCTVLSWPIKTLFESKGKTYDEAKQQGNPACSLKVKKYFKAIQQEQALARTQIKRAKRSFLINYKRWQDLLSRSYIQQEIVLLSC